MENRKESKGVRTGGVLFALFILCLGVFSLMNKVPLFTAIFRLLSLWPLLFIGIGIWLVFRALNYEKIAVVVLALLLVGAMYSVFSRPGLELQSLEEKTALQGVTNLNVSMDLLFGTFHLGSTPENLYVSKGYGQPMQSSVLSTKGGTASLHFSPRGEAFTPFSEQKNEYEILLNESLPVTITASTAFSTCFFDLSNLKVQELELNGGLSSTEITFGETNTKVVLGMGLSTVKIHVPETVGVRVTGPGFASLLVPPNWIKTDDGYKSPNYDSASYRIEIECSMGLSTVEISYV